MVSILHLLETVSHILVAYAYFEMSKRYEYRNKDTVISNWYNFVALTYIFMFVTLFLRLLEK